jgi:hypothetical protein
MIKPKTTKEASSILDRKLRKLNTQVEYDVLMENLTWKLVRQAQQTEDNADVNGCQGRVKSARAKGRYEEKKKKSQAIP